MSVSELTEILVSPQGSLKNDSHKTTNEEANHIQYLPEMGELDNDYEDQYKEYKEGF